MQGYCVIQMQDDGRKMLHHFDIEIVTEHISVGGNGSIFFLNLCCFLICKNQLRQGQILQTVLQARMETVGLAGRECILGGSSNFWATTGTVKGSLAC